MLFQHTRVLGFLLAGPLVGCGEDPTYTLTWRFANEAPAPFSARSCGQAGVESFEGVESRVDGSERRAFKAVCGTGSLERSVPQGEWTVKLQGIDPSGRVPTSGAPTEMVLVGQTGPFVVDFGQPKPLVEVVVTPRKTCADGIDNNANGLVDGDDSVCQSGMSDEVAKTSVAPM